MQNYKRLFKNITVIIFKQFLSYFKRLSDFLKERPDSSVLRATLYFIREIRQTLDACPDFPKLFLHLYGPTDRINPNHYNTMKKIITITLAFLAALAFVGCKQMKIKTLPYPEARIDTTVVEDYHGTAVADPYRWLEDDNSAETAAWVEAENAVTRNYLEQIPYRNAIKDRLTKLMDYPKEGLPTKVGDYYFFFHNDGLQNQSVLYRQKGLDGAAEVFLDPNMLSVDGTVALSGISFSNDNKYMGYTLSKSGSDWVEIHVREVETGAELPDVIEWVKFSGASWGKDGFYYSRYDRPAEGSVLSGQNRFQKVYYHMLGKNQSEDKLVYEDKEHPLRYFHGMGSEDGKYVFVTSSEGTHGSEILYREASKPGRFNVLFAGFDYDYILIECQDDMAWVLTNDHAPNYKLIQVNLKDPKLASKEIIAEDDTRLLETVSSVGGYLIAGYLDKAQSKVYQYDMDGTKVREIELPTIGTVGGFGGKKEFTETFYALTNFITPTSIYRYDLAEGTSELFKKPEVDYNPDLFTAEQVFFPSKDGTQVSMFIVHRKDMRLNGKNPLLLYGYGGFNHSITPSFSTSAIMLMEQGGIYVVVNLRGGGEYGEEWHHAGMLERKQNVFDDFIAAAEYLIEKGYTSKEKLAIQGGSNGGLLVGACMTQRPDLFAVAFPAVGVMDMLRYHKFTIGWGWVVEYGSSDVKEQFEYIYKYSPLHNIIPGTCYPATLVTTADHDDRVVPAHSFKFAATLQAAQGCDRPALIRIDSKAGHGAGKPTSKRIEEMADILSFMFWNTGSKVRFAQ